MLHGVDVAGPPPRSRRSGETSYHWNYTWTEDSSRRQLLQQRLRFLQIARVEPFSEPPVNGSQQFARLLHLALVAPEAGHAHCYAKLPGFGLLLARDRESVLEVGLRFRCIGLGLHQRDCTSNAIDLRVPAQLLGLLDHSSRFADTPPGFVEIPERGMGYR